MAPSGKFPRTTLFKEHPDAIAATVCGLLVFLGWLTLQWTWLGVGLLLLSAAYVVGGFASAREGLTTLFQEKELDVDLLMIVAALGAAGLGLWRREYHLIIDGAILILIFSISGALEGYAMQRTEPSIRSLMSLTSDTARVLVNGLEQVREIAQIQIGDLVRVLPGELVPTDGVIIEGQTTLNEAPISGESMPVEKSIGDEVFAGTINGNGTLKLKIHQPPESSLIGRVIRLVEQAQTEAPPSQQFIERFERGYARVIVLAGVLLAVLPPILFGWTWENTIYRALIFLVVASPCALMASIMPALLSGIANGARQGILFKNGAQLEIMGRVRAIAFDKTGTLTTGKPQVVKVVSATGAEDRLLQVAAALESASEHPIGESIVQAAKERHLQWSEAVKVRAFTSQGIVGEVERQTAVAGKWAFVKEQVDDWSNTLIELAQFLEQEGKTVVWVAHAGQALGIIAVADVVRLDASLAISRLKRLGIEEIVLITGDTIAQPEISLSKLASIGCILNYYLKIRLRLFDTCKNGTKL